MDKHAREGFKLLWFLAGVGTLIAGIVMKDPSLELIGVVAAFMAMP